MKCSGAMTTTHTGVGEKTYSIGIRQERAFCEPCAEAAARLGLIDRRETLNEEYRARPDRRRG